MILIDGKEYALREIVSDELQQIEVIIKKKEDTEIPISFIVFFLFCLFAIFLVYLKK